MATVELVGGHADGDYLHAAELENYRRAANGCGVLASSISATVTQTDLNIVLPAFDYVAPDGSGGRKVVSYAGGTLTRSANSSGNPANDLIVGDASGNVTLRDGTTTAETGDVEDAPEVTLASDEIVIAKVRRASGTTAVLTTHISPRAIDVSDAWPSKGADVASASALNLPEAGTYFDVTGTTGITSIESRPAGTVITLQFDGILTITHNASSLILAGGIDYITAAGDALVFISEGSGNWRQVSQNRRWRYLRKSSDETVNNSSTLQDDDTFVIPVLANREYEVEGLFRYSSGATPDFKFQFTVPSGATIDGVAEVPDSSATTTGALLAEAIPVTTAAGLGDAVPCAVWVRFTIIVSSTAGNVTLQWAQNTSNPSDTKVLANSYLRYRGVS